MNIPLNVTQIKAANNSAQAMNRMAKSRAKHREILEGTYQIPLIEEAKAELKKNDFSLEGLLETEKFKNGLDDNQVRQLRTFIKNNRCRSTSNVSAIDSQQQYQEQLKSETQKLAHLNTKVIHAKLSSVSTPEQRMALITDFIKKNYWGLVNYLEEVKPTGKEVLQDIISQCKVIDTYVSTMLFVKVCKIDHLEQLDVNALLIENAMQFLLGCPKETDAVFGLLRFILQNEIALCEFELERVKKFQDLFQETIAHFFRNTASLKYLGQPILSPTCFCFTEPLITSLKIGGEDIFNNITPDFQLYLTQILCHSFNNDKNQFFAFMESFRNLTKEYFYQLVENNFVGLLQAIYDKTIKQEEGYFRSLIAATKIFKMVYELAQNKKLPSFSEQLISRLLDNDSEQFQMLTQAKKSLGDWSNSKIKEIFVHFAKNNPKIKLDEDLLCGKLAQDEKRLVDETGIVNLLPAQHIVFKYCLDGLHGNNFLQLDTGQGKTMLCYLIACMNLKEGRSTFIINQSRDLTFRDFKKAQSFGENTVVLLNDPTYFNIHATNIIYSSLDQFIQLIKQTDQDQLSEYFFIIDEFDNLFFEETELAKECCEIINKLKVVLGLTGSLLQKHHIEFLTKNLNAIPVNFSLAQNNKIVPVCLEKTVKSTLAEFLSQIVGACLGKISHVPIVIISNDHNQTEQLEKRLVRSGIPCENLISASPEKVESCLLSFTIKSGLSYKVFFINQNQGRGLDFDSNLEIENNGGVFVIIAMVPQQFLQYQQFIGRTGRIGNKGQYSVILFDKKAKNKDGNSYFQVVLDTLKNLDLSTTTTLQVRQATQSINIDRLNSLANDNDVDYDGTSPLINKAVSSFDRNEEIKHNSEHDGNDDESGEDFIENRSLAKQYNIIAPKLFNAYNELGQEKNEDEPKDVVMGNENMENESENSGEVSKDFDEKYDKNDEEYQNTGKSTKRNQGQCKICGKKSDKGHICKRLVASKQSEPTISKTLGKRKRNSNETKTYKQPSMNKRMHKQAEEMFNNANIQQERENNNPSDQDNAYVRVSEALKVVIPSTELQEFKEQDLNNCEDVLAKNQQQQKELSKAQQSSSHPTSRQQILANKQSNKPKSQREMVDKSYFAGYSESSIHKNMLNDLVRVEQYTKAINQTCKDKVVLDIGCGTGVLSVLAIKAGAIKVYAIDNADIEKLMSSEFKQHIKEGKIEFIKGTIEKLALDDHLKIPKVDVVLSEWMGYFLIFENMISSYMLAIKTFLKPEGIVIPSHATMYLDAGSYDFAANTKIAKKHLNNNPSKIVMIDQCKPDQLISSISTSIKTVDFNDIDLKNPLDNEGFACNFKIQVAKAGTFNAFVGSFDTKLCNEVFLNTMPLCPITHWKQSIFFIANPIQVEIGDVIEGMICVKTQEENHRNLIVSLTYKVEGKESSKAEELFSFE